MSRLLGPQAPKFGNRRPPGGHKPRRAEGGLANRRPAVPVHADQLCRQGGDRDRRSPDHAGAAAEPTPVRVARLELFPVVFGVGDRHRLHRQSGADALGVAGHGTGLGVDPVPDDRDGRICRDRGVPDRTRRRRRAGVSGGAPFDLQMVSQRAAHIADRDRRARRRHRDHGGAAAAQLGHRALFLALGLWRARYRRSRLDGGVVGARPRGPTDRRGGDGCGADTRTDRLRTAVAQPDDHGGLVRELRRPVGVVASAVLAGGVSDQRARLCAGLDRPLGRASGGRQRDPGNFCRLVFATPARSRGAEPGGARDLRRRRRRARRRGSGDHAVRGRPFPPRSR